MYEILGPDSIIGNYYAGYCVIPQDATSYSWTATGGAIICGQGSAAITVQWGAAGAGSLEVDLNSPEGALINTVLIPIDIQTGGNTPRH